MSGEPASVGYGCDCSARHNRLGELCATHRAAWPAFRARGLTVKQFLQAGSLPVWVDAVTDVLEPLLAHARRRPHLWRPVQLEAWCWQRVAANSRRSGQLLIVAAPAELAAVFLRRPTSDRTPEAHFLGRRDLGRHWLPLRAALGELDVSVPLRAALAYRWFGFEGRLGGLHRSLRFRPACAGDHWPRSTSPVLARVDAALAWSAHLGRPETGSLGRALSPDLLRLPSSLDGYLRRGFDEAEARRWHRLIAGLAAPLGLVDGEPTLRTARAWRAAGFDAAGAQDWFRPWGRRQLPEPVLGLGIGLARVSAEFHAAGFADLRDAMPYLRLAVRDPALTAPGLFEHRLLGTPLEWLQAWAG